MPAFMSTRPNLDMRRWLPRMSWDANDPEETWMALDCCSTQVEQWGLLRQRKPRSGRRSSSSRARTRRDAEMTSGIFVSAAAPELTIVAVNGLAYCPHGRRAHRQEPLRFFDLRNFGPRVEAREGRNKHFAGDLISTSSLMELCK
jgi:hypothetical protein